MVRDLSNVELELASGGFDNSLSNLNQTRAHHNTLSTSAQVLGLAIGDIKSDITAKQPIKTLSQLEPLDASAYRHNERHTIHQKDGVHRHWESYRPEQPSFRSRFINR